MATYEATIESGWTAEETFGYLAVFSNAQEWDPGVLAGDQLDPGPVHLGTRFKLVVPFLGREVALVYQVTRFVDGDHQDSDRQDGDRQDKEVVLEAQSSMLHARDRIAVRPGPSGGPASVVSYRADVSLRGPLRLVDPVLNRGFRTVGDRAAAGLADTLRVSAPPVQAAGSQRGQGSQPQQGSQRGQGGPPQQGGQPQHSQPATGSS